MWKLLSTIGIDYLKEHVLPRLNLNRYFQATLELLLVMAGKVIEFVTDSNPDNKGQIKALWAGSFVQLLSCVLAGVYDAIQSPGVKEKVVAILKDTLAKLETPAPVASNVAMA